MAISTITAPRSISMLCRRGVPTARVGGCVVGMAFLEFIIQPVINSAPCLLYLAGLILSEPAAVLSRTFCLDAKSTKKIKAKPEPSGRLCHPTPPQV
jgi:hypothetical protein